MDIIATFSTDEALETQGKWFPLSKTAKVLVARAGNDNYLEALRAKMQEAQLDLTAGKEAEKLAEDLIIEVMADTILLGWEGLKSGDKLVPYSREQARSYLRIKDFRKKISAFSDNFEAYRKAAEVEQGKD